MGRMVTQRKKQGGARDLAFALGGLASLVVALIALAFFLMGLAQKDIGVARATEDLSVAEAVMEEPSFEPTQITLSLTGDCTLGTDANFTYSTSLNAYYENYGGAYFLENVKPIFEQDDLTIVNMEGVLTDSTYRVDKQFAFKGPAEFTSILTEGSVEVANLANNHSADYGDQSYQDTIDALDNAGVLSYGYDRTQIVDVKGIKVGLIGAYTLAGFDQAYDLLDTAIPDLQERGAQVIVVTFHGGIEREYAPWQDIKDLAHYAVDLGADLVVGHHPHVLQGVEVYNGKHIAYSLGNFCFGGNSNPSDKDAMIFQQTFLMDEAGEITPGEVNMIPVSISSVSSTNDYRPTPLEGAEAERVLNKIENASNF